MQNTKSTKNLVVFLCTSNELSENETKNIIGNVSKRIKYFGKKLTKEVQDLYTKTTKHCLDKDLNK